LTALAGCGVGFGAGVQEGSADLTVSRDYGSEVLVEEPVGPLTESSTAMRLLDGSAEVETSFGGGFVDSIEAIPSASGARSFDWFYYVNGIAAERGAAEFVVSPGDRMWWDYRDWTDAMDVNAVVGSFPAPLRGGYDGSEWPVSVECLSAGEACEITKQRLDEAGVEVAPDAAGSADALRVLVGEWAEVGLDPDGGRLDAGPAGSGVFARFVESEGKLRLVGLDVRAEPATDFGPHAGLLAAMRRGEGPPVWLVTGADRQGVEAAARSLESGLLRNRYAAAVSPEGVFSLPTGVDG
jgi:hypothetical protein